MKLQDFSGGLSIRLRPQYIQLNEAVLYNNLDNEKGSLVAVPTKVESDISVSRFAVFYDAVKQWVSSAIRKDYVEFQKILYSTDGVNRPQKFDGTTTNNLGIAPPAVKPITTNIPAIDPAIGVRATASGVGNLPNEDLFYRIVTFDGTYYSRPYDFTYSPEKLRGSSFIFNFEEQEDFGRLSLKPINFVTNAEFFTSSVKIDPIDGEGGDLYRLYEGKWRFVHAVTAAGPNPVDSVYDISGNAELEEAKIGPIAGDIQYVYTYFNSLDGAESAPSPVSDTLTDALGAVTLTLVNSLDSQIDKKRIYRIGGFITTFSLVVEIDNITTIYVDGIADTDIIGTILTAQNNNEAPTGLAFLTEANAMLFGAEGSKLRFTPIGEPDIWPILNFLQIENPITGIASSVNGLIVFTKFKAFIVLGSSPFRLSLQPLDGNQGCIDASSVQQLKGAVIWVSSDGICLSNGNTVDVISLNKLGKIALSPIDSVIHNQVYYLVEPNSILAFDYRYGQVFKRFSLGIDAITKGEDILYGHSNGKLHSLFAGSTNESFTYESPKFIEGILTEEKTYRIVYIFSIGDIIINILINDILVITKTLSGTKAHEIKVPQNKQRGNFIQFEITGTGEVLELEYTVGRGHGHGG